MSPGINPVRAWVTNTNRRRIVRPGVTAFHKSGRAGSPRFMNQKLEKVHGMCSRRPYALHARPIRGFAFLLITAFALLTTSAWGQEIEQDKPPIPDPPTPPPAEAEDAPPADQPRVEGPVYVITKFKLQYLREHPDHPPLHDAMLTHVQLAKSESGYIAPRADAEPIGIVLDGVPGLPRHEFHASAVQKILEALRDHFVMQELMGVFVAPDPTQINEFGQDLREEGAGELTIIVTTGIVTELRTLGAGARVDENGEILPDERINHPVHQRIRDRSPLQPWDGEAGDQVRRDLLKKNILDRQLFHLSRHPGRRVDASVAAAEEIGGIALDYMVTENRPLTLYAQVSNTGTRSTDYWRERFGLFHTQVTDNDDVFTLDYTTANFDNVHAVNASYECPLPNDRIRWKVYGGWSEYTASDIGFFNDTFTGETWRLGTEIAWNVYQKREMFIDLVGGVRYEDIETDNEVFAIHGDEAFITPYVGTRYERKKEWFSTNAELLFEYQPGWGVDDDELVRLGRTQPDDEWLVARWNASHSVYLEPLFNYDEWADPNTPESSTLAHELMFKFKGQYAFGDRLIPQAEGVAGGLYTVRGYPQSVVAGDTMVVGTIEYRYHVPRAFEIETEPGELFGKPFRKAPQYVYGMPDWDLVLKGFLDVGRVVNSDRLSFEQDETLIGAGVGVDFLYRRNLTVRLDWGFVLEEMEDRDVNSGSNRLHLVVTVLF
jgi:hemolysin activation/secretion protein